MKNQQRGLGNAPNPHRESHRGDVGRDAEPDRARRRIEPDPQQMSAPTGAPTTRGGRAGSESGSQAGHASAGRADPTRRPPGSPDIEPGVAERVPPQRKGRAKADGTGR